MIQHERIRNGILHIIFITNFFFFYYCNNCGKSTHSLVLHVLFFAQIRKHNAKVVIQHYQLSQVINRSSGT